MVHDKVQLMSKVSVSAVAYRAVRLPFRSEHVHLSSFEFLPTLLNRRLL